MTALFPTLAALLALAVPVIQLGAGGLHLSAVREQQRRAVEAYSSAPDLASVAATAASCTAAPAGRALVVGAAAMADPGADLAAVSARMRAAISRAGVELRASIRYRDRALRELEVEADDITASFIAAIARSRRSLVAAQNEQLFAAPNDERSTKGSTG